MSGSDEVQSTDEQGAGASAGDKQQAAERVLNDILNLMELEARLELKPSEEGGIAVALHPSVEIPGVGGSKRSQVIDSLQFLANKIVNRTGERRWISIGVNGFPEPRKKKEKPAPAARPAPAPNGAAGKPQKGRPAAAPAAEPSASAAEPNEKSVGFTVDPVMAELGKRLAERSAKLGRFYGIGRMSLEDRARMIAAANGVEGVTVRAEGVGRNRRLVYAPHQPSPMPKRVEVPDYDEEELEE